MNQISFPALGKRGEVMRFNKKASLEISIQAIVIVVLAMTLLGLGLGFVRNMFKNIESTTGDVSEQVRQKILDDLITGDKKVSFPKSEIVIDRGSSTILTVGIRNKNDATLNYKISFNAVSAPTGVDPHSWFQYNREQTYNLAAADAEVRNIRLSIPKGTPAGSYFIVLEIKDTGATPISPATTVPAYAQKDFFVVVRG